MSLRHVLLALLSKQPNTGYGLGRLLHHELNHCWDARLQQIYTELGKLEAQGLVQAEAVALPNRPAKKTYALTPAGFEALDHWLAQPVALALAKNELLVKLYCLERLARDVVVRRLEEQRDRCEVRAGELRQRLADVTRTDLAELGRRLTLEAALAHAEAEATWCIRALALVEQEGQASPSERPATARTT